MRASAASGGRSLSQYSQFGRSSSAMSPPRKTAKASKRGPASRGAQPVARHVQSSRPLQNRVDPFGELRAAPERGGLMGNRGGRLHRDDQTLSGSRWKNKHWLICVCEFKGRRRDVWGQVLHRALLPRRADSARRRPPPVLRVPQASGESLYRRFSRRSERRGGDGRSAPPRAGREPAANACGGRGSATCRTGR